jgi:hypothetical protein
MSGCPVRQVRHIYRRNGGGPITNYSTIGGICKICPPPPPPPPVPNIQFSVHSDVQYFVTFKLYGGSGTYDLGNGILHTFSAPLGLITITGLVPVGATVLIYGSNIQTFETVDQPVSYLNVSNCPTLRILRCNQTSFFQSYLTGPFDISTNPNLIEVQFLRTLISGLPNAILCPGLKYIDVFGDAFDQTAADQLVNDLVTIGGTNGYLRIRNQAEDNIDITGFIYTALTNLNWTIV